MLGNTVACVAGVKPGKGYGVWGMGYAWGMGYGSRDGTRGDFHFFLSESRLSLQHRLLRIGTVTERTGITRCCGRGNT